MHLLFLTDNNDRQSFRKDGPHRCHFSPIFYCGSWLRSQCTQAQTVGDDEIARYISVIDVALVNLRKAEAFKTVIPSKIFENAAMGKPILLGVEGESEAIIKKYGAGLCFVPEDREDFLHQLSRLATDTDLYAACRANCAPLAAAYDRGALAARMLEVLRGVLR